MKNEKIKENIELIPLTRDFMFKHIFTNNPNILKKFLISVLNLILILNLLVLLLKVMNL